jgi:hypothetical protein
MRLKYILLNVFLIFISLDSFAADLYITDISGSPGPSYNYQVTSYVYIDNAPNALTRFNFAIHYNQDILKPIASSYGPLLTDWDYTVCGFVSGSSNYIYMDCWTLGQPIKKGVSGLLLEIVFEVKGKQNSILTLDGLEFDMDGWTTQGASFEYTTQVSVIPPLANAGPDQVAINHVNLDGSGSLDTDGEIVSWNWVLTHAADQQYNLTASGEKFVVNPAPGFYNVVLTVTDDTGLTDTDTMTLAVASPPKKGDINTDGIVTIDDIIYGLQILTDVK